MKKKLLHQELGTPLNEGLRRLMPNRIEYGLQDDIVLDFEVTAKSGSCKLVTEEEFSKWRGTRTIGLFGKNGLCEAMKVAERLYPDAGIWVKKEPKRHRISR